MCDGGLNKGSTRRTTRMGPVIKIGVMLRPVSITASIQNSLIPSSILLDDKMDKAGTH